MMTITGHPDSAVRFGEAPTRPYLPNYAFVGPYIDEFHRRLADSAPLGGLLDLGIPGWLWPADGLKLYEGAYHGDGDVLELGTHRGLSTFILASALVASGGGRKVATIDLDPDASADAQRHLAERGVSQVAEFIVADGRSACEALIAEHRKFGFAFIDHSHAYNHVASACSQLPALMKAGAMVAFHDYNDTRNTRARHVGETNAEYGVRAAIEDCLSTAEFAFVGVYGACGVFQRL